MLNTLGCGPFSHCLDLVRVGVDTMLGQHVSQEFHMLAHEPALGHLGI